MQRACGRKIKYSNCSMHTGIHTHEYDRQKCRCRCLCCEQQLIEIHDEQSDDFATGANQITRKFHSLLFGCNTNCATQLKMNVSRRNHFFTFGFGCGNLLNSAVDFECNERKFAIFHFKKLTCGCGQLKSSSRLHESKLIS